MSWNLTGSYVETCSCELMCPCNLSFDHGATYDFCRVTLVFNIREGEVDGTDIGGPQGGADRRHAEGHDRRQLAARRVRRRRRRPTSSSTSWSRSSAASSGGPMAGARSAGRRDARASSGRRSRSSDDGLRHSVRVGDVIDFEIEDIVPFGVETGRAGAVRRHVPPGRVEPDDGRGEALADQRLRHPVRGQDRSVDVRLLLGRLTPMSAPAQERSPAAAVSRRRSPRFASGSGWSPLLFALAGVGWWWTADQMRGMDDGPWTGLGTFGWFLGVWVVMMAAMMFPSVAPTVALYSRMTRQRSPLSPLAVRGRLPGHVGRRRGGRLHDRRGR